MVLECLWSATLRRGKCVAALYICFVLMVTAAFYVVVTSPQRLAREGGRSMLHYLPTSSPLLEVSPSVSFTEPSLGGESGTPFAFQQSGGATPTSGRPENHSASTDPFMATVDPVHHAVNAHHKMVVGILSAPRNPPSVLTVAERLAKGVDTAQFRLVVWQAHPATNEHQKLKTLGYTVYTQELPYSELEDGRLQITLGDTKERMLWRTRQVLDYANLLEWCLESKPDYILILEDDMMPAHNAIDKVYSSLKSIQAPTDKIGYVAFFSVASHRSHKNFLKITGNLGYEGACANAYPSSVVPKLIAHLRANMYAKPVDLLIAKFIEKELRLDVYERIPHLFQHNSKRSSFASLDQEKRKTELLRSIHFIYDESNSSLQYLTSQSNGYIGCFVDSREFSDLSGKFYPINDCSDHVCRSKCRDYIYFGIQRGEGTIVCQCGNEFGFYGRANDSDCEAYDGSVKCGKPMANAVYRVDTLRASLIGCYRDDQFHRDLDHAKSGTHSVFTCAQACSSYKYFGVQFGGECYCGDTFGRYGRVDDALCSSRCTTNAKLTCGGTLVNTVFKFL